MYRVCHRGVKSSSFWWRSCDVSHFAALLHTTVSRQLRGAALLPTRNMPLSVTRAYALTADWDVAKPYLSSWRGFYGTWQFSPNNRHCSWLPFRFSQLLLKLFRHFQKLPFYQSQELFFAITGNPFLRENAAESSLSGCFPIGLPFDQHPAVIGI